jgi:uncharacterized lipoprotein YbaY
MRSLLITAALVGAALLLGGCQGKKPEPIPAPKTVVVARHLPSAHAAKQREVGEISWFQGTLEEAFSRRTCPSRALFRY